MKNNIGIHGYVTPTETIGVTTVKKEGKQQELDKFATGTNATI